MGRMQRAALRGVTHSRCVLFCVCVYDCVYDCVSVYFAYACLCLHARLYVLRCLLLLARVRVCTHEYVCIFVYTQTCARERNPPTRALQRPTTGIGPYVTH